MKPLLPLALLLIGAGPDLPVSAGRWITTVTITDVTIADAPPGVAAALKGRPMVTNHCVTPEQARQGMRGAMRSDTGCKFTDVYAQGGIVRTRMTCNRPTGAMTAVSSGTYTANGYALDTTMTGSGRMRMTMKSRTTARRTGAC